MTALTRLQNRLDAQAIGQLRAEVAALAERVEQLEAENERLQQGLADAEDRAEEWRQDFMALQLSAYPDAAPGITRDGRLVVVE